MPSSYPNIILFDGVCNLCNATVRFIINRDKKKIFRFAALQSEAGQFLMQPYSEEQALTTLFYIRNGTCFRESTAILYILKDLQRGWQLLYPLIFLPICLRDRIYRCIARNRYKIFGKRPSCMIPSPEIKDRFI